MGMLDKLQDSCSDTEQTKRGGKLWGLSLYKFNYNTKYRMESDSCHLLQGQGSMNGHLKYRFLWICVSHGWPQNNLMQNRVLALQVQVQMTEGPRQVWNYEKTTSIKRSLSYKPKRFLRSSLLHGPKASVKTEGQSVHPASANPCLPVLRPSNFISTSVQSKENSLGMSV